MENGSKQERSTGSSQPTDTGSEKGSVQPKSTAKNEESQTSKDVPLRDESSNSIKEVSTSALLAILVMMGDFKELKDQIPTAWQASSKGKIYWCAEIPGHELAVENGKLLVDGAVVDSKILEE